MKIKIKERVLRAVISIIIGTEFDSLKFHNFYHHSKYGKKLIDCHTKIVVQHTNEVEGYTNKLNIIKSSCLFPFNYKLLISSNPSEYGSILNINSRRGMSDTVSIQNVDESVDVLFDKTMVELNKWLFGE